MTPDQYVQGILAKYAVPRGPSSPAETLGAASAGPLRHWAGSRLNKLEYSGSYAKETGVHGISDVDLFISLRSDTPGTLRDIFEGLYSFAHTQGWAPRRQNVSIGVTIGGTRADLVPGRVQSGYQNYHSLYLSKSGSWTQTNITHHINTVRSSGRVDEIRAIKIWRLLHRLDFPSFYLELFTIQALQGRSRATLSDNVIHALRMIAASLASTRIVDPANTNNIVSEELTAQEKQRVSQQASASAKQPNWGQIIW